MKNILKLVTGLFLGVLVTASASSVVKAETVYYVKNDGTVTAQDSYNRCLMADLPEGAVIPAGSTVYVEGGVANKALEAQCGLLTDARGMGLVQYKSTLPAKVTYDDNQIQLTYSVSPGINGSALLATQLWNYETQIAAQTFQNEWNWAVNGWKATACWAAPVCTPAPCYVAPICVPAPCYTAPVCAPAPCWTAPQPYTFYDYQNAVQEMCTALGNQL